MLLARGGKWQQGLNPDASYAKFVDMLYPSARMAAAEIPEPARRFLQQALETLHAPDAAAVMAGAAVDGMLKARGYNTGSLYARIDQAVSDHVLTKEMGDWAHWVRLGSNRPRHADKDSPHVSIDEARQSVEFTEALGQFLFVLSARIASGIAAAQSSSSTPSPELMTTIHSELQQAAVE